MDKLDDLLERKKQALKKAVKLNKKKKAKKHAPKKKATHKSPFEPLINQYEVTEFTKETNPFRVLGAYPKFKVQLAHTDKWEKQTYNLVHYGIDNQDDYCERVDHYNLAHPENIFGNKNFFTDYGKGSLPRNDVMYKIGNLFMKQVQKFKNQKRKQRLYHFDVEINSFFVASDGFYSFHEIGKNFLCATQMYNRIPGQRALIRKDDLVESVDKYAAKFEDKPQCFNKQMFFPFSYRLYREDECKQFLSLINSQKYIKSLKTEPIQYLIKVGHGSHSANGVFILDKAKTKEINQQYNFGKKCGKVTEPLLAQTYVTNPLLLDLNNKFDFRIYMLVASVNPLIIYYHDGFLRASLSEYDKFSHERGKHLTNTHLAENIFKKARDEKVNGMTEKQLRDYHIWNFQELEDYLVESGKTNDPNWLDNTLRPQFRKAMIHAVKMASEFFWKQSNVYGLFGLDFMLDDNFNLWFIEGNPNPQLAATNNDLGNLLRKMLRSLHEIEYGLYKSRMTRVLKVIQRFQKVQEKDGKLDLAYWQKEYKNANSNKFEAKYRPSKDNSFVLVMDESLKGAKAYQGNLAKECVTH